jgi:hypothetical protein
MKFLSKLLLASFILILVSTSFVFADEAFDKELDAKVAEALGDTSQLMETVDSLILHGLFRNKKLVRELTFDLNLPDRLGLFKKYYMNPVPYIASNFWPGFGIGSLGQRDFLAFIPHMILDGAGALGVGIGASALVTVFTIDLVVNFFAVLGGSDKFIMTFGPDSYKWSLIVMAGGAGVCLVSRLISMIWPNIYAKRYNKTLRNSLDTEIQEDVSFVPLIDPFNKKFGLAAKIIL